MSLSAITIKLFRRDIPVVWILTFLVLAPRLFIFIFALLHHLNLPLVESSDALSYVRSGANIFQHHIFDYRLTSPLHPDSFRTPLYPIFVYLFSLGLWSLNFLSLVQYLLVVLTAIIIYRLSKRIFDNHSVAFLSAALFALEPFYIFWSGLVMTEVLFTFLLVIMFWYAYELLTHPQKFNGFFTGLFFGLASLTRPVIFPFFGIFWLIIIIALWRQKIGWRKLILPLLALTLGFMIVVLPWSIRNKYNFNSWNLSSVGSYNLYFYDSALVLSRSYHISWDEAINKLKRNLSYNSDIDLITFTDLHYEHQLLKATQQLIWQNPKAFAIVRLHNIAALLTDDGYHHLGNFFGVRTPAWLKLVGRGFWLLQYLAIIIWVIKKSSNLTYEKKIFIMMSLVTIAYFAVVAGGVASARYRVPIQPLIFLLSAPGIYLLAHRRSYTK